MRSDIEAVARVGPDHSGVGPIDDATRLERDPRVLRRKREGNRDR
jgi:hypothetical protein